MSKKVEINVEDIERLYTAFTQICDYVEQKTEGGCGKCPRYEVCFGMAGHLFAESLKNIKEALDR